MNPIRTVLLALSPLAAFVAGSPAGQSVPQGQRWVASWTASAQGPYPSGNASAQPVLDHVFEAAERGANDQTFRLIVRPDLWGRHVRLRFSNAFGTSPVTFDGVFVGLQGVAGNVVAGTNRAVTFDGGRPAKTVGPGESAQTDAVELPFVEDPASTLLAGRKLAVSVHTPHETGPMTWHAKALQTSYVSPPRAGSRGGEEADAAFPYTTTSWYFLEAVDVLAPEGTGVVVCFGDSITDGTGSTLNGDDRWPDVLSRRLHARYGTRVSVVNAGIGGNRITGPPTYSAALPFAGGPSALDRLDRDVLGQSGVSSVVWLEGTNDLAAGASAEAVIAGLRAGVARLRTRAGLRIIGATITPSLGAATGAGTPDVDERRRAVNAFIRTGGLFDGVLDFDQATVDPRTGGLRASFQPTSTLGGPGDGLHPNRAGYQAMAEAIDLRLLAPRDGR